MLDTILFFAHYTAILLFGIVLSFAFAGIRLSRGQNLLSAGILFAVCGILQLVVFYLFDEQLVWKLYPLITHLPILVFLWLRYRKRLVTALSAITTAYLCCQPAKWVGLLVSALTRSYAAEQAARILMLLAVAIISLYYLVPFLSKLFNKDTQSICIFGSIPMAYYLFDYITGIYTYLWVENARLTGEFLPFALCIIFMIFCVVYYKEYEQKADAERKEQLIRISAQQQSAQMEAVKRTEKELRILRHDMRLFLSGLALCIENGEQENAKEMISSYASRIEGTRLAHFCESDIVNYVLSDFSEKCKSSDIPFSCNVEIDSLHVDEMLFCSILSNALDNALNAQEALPKDKQGIKLMLKKVEGKLLLSVKNMVLTPPLFSDGLPVASRKGHGYGTQSIRYITEQLGGNCQFSIQDSWFIVRVVL